MANVLDDASIELLRRVVREVLVNEFPHLSGPNRSREPRQFIEGILDVPLNTGGSANMSIYTGPQGTWTDTTETVEVEFPAGQGVDVAVSSYCIAARINGAWRPIAAVC